MKRMMMVDQRTVFMMFQTNTIALKIKLRQNETISVI